MAAPFEFDLPDGSLRVAEAALATAAGLALFFVLVPRRRRPAEAVASAGDYRPMTPAAGAPDTGLDLSPPDNGFSAAPDSDEATLPRWLRPSVQEGRYRRRVGD